MKLKKTHMHGFEIYYRNENELNGIYTEIFGNEALLFPSSEKRPFILDCGSHIGLATLYFKLKYPDAQIIAFEPDPGNCYVLKRNVEANNLADITIVNAAVSNFDGELNYYGELSGESPDSRGNSIIKAWGYREHNDVIVVRTVKLSSYIDRPVDYLKLDIEGAELQVLEDIRHKLRYVKELYAECHEMNTTTTNADLARIISLLESALFEVKVIKKDMSSFLPKKLHKWAARVNPSLAIIRASNTQFAS